MYIHVHKKMSSKRNKRNSKRNFPVAESVSIALKIQLDKFIEDERETELKFPTFLSAQERGFLHETAGRLGLKSKSRGKGTMFYLKRKDRAFFHFTSKGRPTQYKLPFQFHDSFNYDQIFLISLKIFNIYLLQ